MDILTYALAKSYTDKALLGVGTIKGAPCTVKSQTEDDEYVYVTLGWENSLGTPEETVVKIKKGADGAPGEPGPAGDPGPRGVSITKIEKIKTEDLIDTYQISFSDNTTFEYTISNGSTDYLKITNKPSIEGVELIGNKTFEDLNIASADALSATDENLQNLSNLIGDKTSLPAPTDTIVNNIASVDAKVDAIIDDNETGLAKTFSSDKITKTFATKEEIPTVPTKVSELTNDSNYQTAEQVNSTVTTEIAKIVADAPEDLNTLKEMSDWIAGHENDASAMNSAISDNKTAITALQTGKADKSEIPTTLPANGGNADTVNNHTVETNVPADAVFTDTIYDDTEVKESIEELNNNLDGLGYGERCAYNIIKPILQTTTLNGLTCTKNLGADGKPDGTYTVNGTASKKTIFHIVDSNGIELNTNSNAKLIGCPSGGSSSTYSLTLYDEKNNKWYDDYGNGKNISDTSKITMYIQIYSGVTVSNIIFKPMITFDTTATYDDYKPYIPSVKMLAEESTQQNTEAMDLKMLGWTVPSECPIQNEVSGNQFIQKVGRIDLGSLDWFYNNTYLIFYSSIADGKFTGTVNGIENAFCIKYNTTTESYVTFSNNSISVGNFVMREDLCGITIKDTSYTDATTFKNAMKGVYLYYELETPIIMIIDGNEAVTQIKNDLDTLEFGEVAGGKNLFDGKIIVGEGIYAYAKLPKSNVHISISDRDINVDISNISFGLSNTVVPDTDTMNWAFVNNGTIVGRDSNDFINSSFTAKSLSIFPNDANTVTKILQRFNIQIEEGDTATPYEPYIPSVKMLADENAQQNTEAMDLKMLGWTVPSECPVQNEVSGNQFIQKVGRVDLGSLTWYYSVNRFYTVLEGGKHTSNYNGVDAYCDKYNNAKDKDHSTFDNKEFSIGSNFASNATCSIVIRDDSYTNESAFKTAMQGVYLYYELATPITMTIDGNEAVEQIKSNLDNLEYGGVAGGKNICKASDNGVVNEISLIKKDISTIIISGASDSRAISKNFNVKKGVTYTATFFTSSTNVTGFLWNPIKQVNAYPFGSSKTITFTPTEDETLNFAVTLTATVSNVEISIQVEEGSKSTSYEPYIPSVKMLADEVSAQNESLSDYGLVNKANGWLQRDSSRIVTPKTSCTEGKTIRFIADYDINYFGGKVFVFYNSSGTQVGDTFSIAKQDSTITVPSGATSFEVLMYKDNGISASGNYPYSLYVDNAIDELKNDLDKLNSLPIGSIIQIDADKDDIETTKQKYGWQYLGTSNIQYENGGATLLVTNVYRKNN